MFGQIGLGNWGLNLLRNFINLSDCSVKIACDADQRKFGQIKKTYPLLELTSDYNRLLKDDEIQAVVIATPGDTHYAVAKQALTAGKHVFIEKPMTLKSKDAKELTALAKKKNKKLMVGHLLMYHPVIRALKEQINNGAIGEVRYMYFRRANLGKIRTNENALWSLAPHDISLVLYLLKKRPLEVSSVGANYVQNGIEDVTFTSLILEGGQIANLYNSWLDPVKERRLFVIGEKGMLLADEMAENNKLKLIKKYPVTGPKGVFNYLDDGTQNIPYEDKEPLQEECKHFISCIKNNVEPLSNGENGLEVIKILECAQLSLKNKGKPVAIK